MNDSAVAVAAMMRCAGMAKPHREQELKLRVPDGSVQALARHSLLRHGAGGRAPPRHETTVYFDTPDEALARRGISLRVRTSGGNRMQTVKADRQADATADRAEWEWPLAQDGPDAGLLVQTGLAGDLPQPITLRPVLCTEIERVIHVLRPDADTEVEAALDQGVIAAGDASQPVRELELEYRRGDPAALYRLALALHAVAPMTIEQDSKAARGYRLRHGAAPEAHKAPAIVLPRRISGARAFRRIVAAGLDHLLSNRAATLVGSAEGLHQMRVAIRRLRAALVLFRPHLEPSASSRFDDELRRVGRLLGEARDWDVFCRDTVPLALTGDGPAAWSELLQQQAQPYRAAAYDAVAGELASPGFTALVLGLAAWAAQGDGGGRWLGDAALDRPMATLCPRLLDRLADKAMRRGRQIAAANDAQRHALRKTVKKLRYGIDFVAALYPSAAVRRYRRAGKRLQQVLGNSNDAVAAMGLAERLAAGPRVDLAAALGVLGAGLARSRGTVRRQIPKRWRKLRATPRFWS